MSGVAAVLERNGTGRRDGVRDRSGVHGRSDDGAPATRLDAMLERLAHRGPDGTGRWHDGAVALGHQQHVTTPEARHAEPPERRASLVVTADVRLDNRSELRRVLNLAESSGTVTDEALLLAAYERWGVTCPEHLLGAFAFALWDGDRQRLYCARDHVGVKPLYVANDGDRFLAASEPGPVLDHTDGSALPDDRRVGDFLVGRYPDDETTFHAGLDRIPPGHWTVATADGVRTEQYWSPNDVDPDALADVSDYERRFRELFTEAVAARLRTAGPPASLLSGGVDSSSIVSVAGELLEEGGRPPLRTFSAVFDTVTACDESRYVQAVLDGGRFEPTFVAGDQVDPLSELEERVEKRRAPFYPALSMLIWRLSSEVGASDADVMLQGYGGDQVMGSNPVGYFRWLATRGRIRTLVDELQAFARRYGMDARDVFRRDVARALAPRPVRIAYQRLRDVDHLGGTMVSIDRSFAERSGLTDRLVADARRPDPRSQRELRRRAITPGEPTFNLELNDVAGARVGVEPRYPYFDRRLVEFSLALPPGATVADGLDRTIVRDALAGTLPTAVRERSDKMEFSPNVVHCTREYALDRIEGTLFDGPLLAGRYLDAEGLRASLDALESTGDVSAARELLLSTTLETWLERHTAVTP